MTATEQILQQIKRSVLSTDPDATVILYGSYARGELRDDSDIDVLVLIDKEKVSYDDRRRIGDPIHHMELETGLMISPAIFSKQLWVTKHRVGQFYRNVMKDGIKL